MCAENFTYTKKFYVYEIATVDLSKIYFLKNAKKTCKPNNCDLNRDWKMFLNNKKIPIIPLLFYENWFVTDFKKKAELFNSFFPKQCTVVNNGSRLPSELLLKTDKFLSNIIFSSDDILKIIQNLDSEKAHDFDRINIQMLKICGLSICKTLEVIFKSCIESGIFPLEWKKANAFPVHKRWQTISSKLSANLTSSNLWKNIWTSFT